MCFLSVSVADSVVCVLFVVRCVSRAVLCA